MDSARLSRTNQDDIDYSGSQATRKFNVTPAPIIRPPSAYGNTSARIQKIKPAAAKKRHKWNDRFHLQPEEQKQFQPAFTAPTYKPHQQRKKAPNTYSTMHVPQSEKKKVKQKKKVIPPRDPLTGRRQWGKKKNRKRAKWLMKKSDTTQKSRAKWNKASKAQDINPLSLSQSRVLSIVPSKAKQSVHKSTHKVTKIKPNEENSNISFNKKQKKEISELFSECLKNAIENKDNVVIKKKIDKSNKVQIEMKEENEELYDTQVTPKNAENPNSTNIKQKPKRVRKRLLPITSRTKTANEQKKLYLEPLDKVADIILDDLIDQIAQELDTFCCQIVDTLIQNETNLS